MKILDICNLSKLFLPHVKNITLFNEKYLVEKNVYIFNEKFNIFKLSFPDNITGDIFLTLLALPLPYYQ